MLPQLGFNSLNSVFISCERGATCGAEGGNGLRPIRSSSPSPPHKRSWINIVLLLLGIWCFTVVLVQAQAPTFYSILTKDKTRLNPITSFSYNDRIYLYTAWTGLKGDHEIKVLWIRPDKTVQETSRFTVKIPPNAQNNMTWAWLYFKKGLLNISSVE